MKVTDVRTRPYAHDLKRRLGDANAPEGFGRTTGVAVFVDTDEGVTGVAVGAGHILPVIPTLADCVIGEDPRSVRGLWQRMVSVAFKGGNRGAVSWAISAIDCALWDLRAKWNGVPLWKELGATTNRVKAYASGLDTPLDDEELAAYYQSMAGLGISAGKLKVGLDQEADLRRLGIMRQALERNDGRSALMIDSNEYWSPKQAIRRIREMEQNFDLVWCEEPARRWDYRGLRRVSESIAAAVATGENLNEAGEFVPLVDNRAVDVVQIGAGTTGITGAMGVAELAYSFELPVAMMNCPGRFMAHLAAVLPHHNMMEVVDSGRDATFSVDNRIEDGWIVLGSDPGAGIAYDEDKLEAASKAFADKDTITSVYRRGPGAGTHEGSAPPSG